MTNTLILLSLTYLLLDDIARDDPAAPNPLYYFAVEQWSSQMLKIDSNHDEEVYEAVETLFLNPLHNIKARFICQFILSHDSLFPLGQRMIRTDYLLDTPWWINGVFEHNSIVLKLFTRHPELLTEEHRGIGTPLMKAIAIGGGPMMSLLLVGGADIYQCYNDNFRFPGLSISPLSFALGMKRSLGADMILDMVEEGIDETPPVESATNDRPPGAQGLERKLLTYAAELDARGGDNSTIFLAALERGYYEFVRILLGAGYNFASRTFYGKSALQIALEREHSTMAGFLIAQGADVAVLQDSPACWLQWVQTRQCPPEVRGLQANERGFILLDVLKVHRMLTHIMCLPSGVASRIMDLAEYWILFRSSMSFDHKSRDLYLKTLVRGRPNSKSFVRTVEIATKLTRGRVFNKTACITEAVVKRPVESGREKTISIQAVHNHGCTPRRFHFEGHMHVDIWKDIDIPRGAWLNELRPGDLIYSAQDMYWYSSLVGFTQVDLYVALL